MDKKIPASTHNLHHYNKKPNNQAATQKKEINKTKKKDQPENKNISQQNNIKYSAPDGNDNLKISEEANNLINAPSLSREEIIQLLKKHLPDEPETYPEIELYDEKQKENGIDFDSIYQGTKEEFELAQNAMKRIRSALNIKDEVIDPRKFEVPETRRKDILNLWGGERKKIHQTKRTETTKEIQTIYQDEGKKIYNYNRIQERYHLTETPKKQIDDKYKISGQVANKIQRDETLTTAFIPEMPNTSSTGIIGNQTPIDQLIQDNHPEKILEKEI